MTAKLSFRSVASLLMILIPSFLLSSCGGEDQSAPAIQPTTVITGKVTKSDVPTIMEFVGETKGSVDAEIRARVEGVITSINFVEGQPVKKDQLLYTVDPAPFQAKVAEAEGNLSAAITKKEKASSDVARYRPLAEIKAVSAKTLDSAVAEEGAAAGAVAAMQAAVDAAKIEMSYTKITSPVDGVIGMTKAKIGEFVGKPPNPVILNTVSNLSEIHVKFSVTEQEYLKFARLRRDQLEAGMQPEKRVLELVLADGSVHPDKGEIAFADRQVDSKTGTLAVEARFPNPHELLRPGQFAKVRGDIGTRKGAVLIPKRAKSEIQGKNFVFLVKPDNTVEQREIVLAGSYQDSLIVDSGLSEGDTIVTEGSQRLKSGALVAPQQG